jgi:hypothetical protein
VLASVGEALAHLAGTDANAFAATQASVPALHANATIDVGKDSKSPRANQSLAYLSGAW